MKRKKELTDIRDVAEKGAVNVIRANYERLGLADGWPPSRVLQTCSIMGITPRIMAANCNVSWTLFRRWLTQARFPGHASLTVYLIEKAYMSSLIEKHKSEKEEAEDLSDD